MTALTHEGSGVQLAHPNPIRGRVNAAFFAWMDWYMHWKYAAQKRALFAELPDTVVELGAGTGANFRYRRPGTKVIAIEPNHLMHPALRKAAKKHGLELEIRSAGAEGIELESSSIEAVICSLVLCTVEDPEQAVVAVKRVLAPGGRFLCVEHVAAPATTWIGRFQRWVFRPWRWVFEGCHTHRDTGALLREAGFDEVRIEPFTWPSVFVPVRPQILARCVA
jgi:ubiquinone/menaquinone biosynthesis C-methylase UbiE